ncbi:MAG TPA: pectinesterase family protein, partial [Chitinophagaceae bacterium]
MRQFFLVIAFIFSGLYLIGQKKWMVSKDGNGQFTTVQAALDAVPKNNKEPIVIFIKEGVYKEKLHLDSTKNFVTLEGESKFNTILTYSDHSGKIAPTGETINTRTSWSFIIRSDDFKAFNLTFENNAGFTAGQAVAV